MNTFTWLLLGHLIGDWLLQNDWMARGKRIRFFTLPGLAHFLVYAITVLATLWLDSGTALPPPTYGLAFALLFVSHWVIDASSIVAVWMRLLHQTDIPMVRIMVDQTFHCIILAIVATLAVSA